MDSCLFLRFLINQCTLIKILAAELMHSGYFNVLPGHLPQFTLSLYTTAQEPLGWSVFPISSHCRTNPSRLPDIWKPVVWTSWRSQGGRDVPQWLEQYCSAVRVCLGVCTVLTRYRNHLLFVQVMGLQMTVIFSLWLSSLLSSQTSPTT